MDCNYMISVTVLWMITHQTKKKASLGTIANAYQLMWLYNPRQKNCTLNRISAGPLRELSSPARKEKTVGFLTA